MVSLPLPFHIRVSEVGFGFPFLTLNRYLFNKLRPIMSVCVFLCDDLSGLGFSPLLSYGYFDELYPCALIRFMLIKIL